MPMSSIMIKSWDTLMDLIWWGETGVTAACIALWLWPSTCSCIRMYSTYYWYNNNNNFIVIIIFYSFWLVFSTIITSCSSLFFSSVRMEYIIPCRSSTKNQHTRAYDLWWKNARFCQRLHYLNAALNTQLVWSDKGYTSSNKKDKVKWQACMYSSDA